MLLLHGQREFWAAAAAAAAATAAARPPPPGFSARFSHTRAPPPHPQIRIGRWQLRYGGVPLGRPAKGAACGLSFRAVAAAELARLVAERGGWAAVNGYALAEEIVAMVVDHLATLRTLCFGDRSSTRRPHGSRR